MLWLCRGCGWPCWLWLMHDGCNYFIWLANWPCWLVCGMLDKVGFDRYWQGPWLAIKLPCLSPSWLWLAMCHGHAVDVAGLGWLAVACLRQWLYLASQVCVQLSWLELAVARHATAMLWMWLGIAGLSCGGCNDFIWLVICYGWFVEWQWLATLWHCYG
jgi:hypothetical protein